MLELNTIPPAGADAVIIALLIWYRFYLPRTIGRLNFMFLQGVWDAYLYPDS